MKFKKKVLENGIRVIAIPMKDNPTVTWNIYVKTGSLNETKDKNGLAHFLEHMNFKGTEKRPNYSDIHLEFDSIGAESNAWTGFERTVYYAKADNKHLDKIADAISDIALFSVFPEEEIKKEKGVVLGEIAMYEDDPQGKVEDVLQGLMYGNKEPIGWPILGEKDTVNSFSRNDLLTFRDEQYSPENIVVVVAGGITEKEVFDLSERLLGNIKKRKIKERVKSQEFQELPAIKTLVKNTDQSHILFGFRAFDMNDPDRFVLRLIKTVLSGGMSSRLFSRIRSELGAGYYIHSGYNLSFDTGVYTIATGTKPERVNEVIDEILNEVRKIVSTKVSDKELSLAKGYLRGKRAMSLETSDDLASYFGSQEIMYNKILLPEEFEKKHDSITTEDIQRVAKRIFNNRNLNLAIVGPKQDEEFIKKTLRVE